VLLEGGTYAQYLPTGHLLYARDGALYAAAFDLHESRVTGVSVRVLDEVRTSPRWGHADFAVSENGTLAYVPGGAWGVDYRVVWVDRRGQKTAILDAKGAYLGPRLSPDGRLIALDPDGANARLEILDLERGTLTPLVAGFDNAYPVWSPLGDRLAFMSTREGAFNLFSIRTDGSSTVERLTTSERNQFTGSWGKELLAFTETHPDSGEDIWTLSMFEDRVPRPFLQSAANESAPAVSPDDRWIAYTSDESGREEVYLLPAQETGGRHQVSTEGGSLPRWRADGRELFYLQGDQMMTVETRIDENPRLGLPKKLFALSQGLIALYDVTPDGQRFVMVDASESEPPPKEIILVQNWFEEVKRLVPRDN
jgi:Tol biopolymer transport system component